MLVPSSLWRIEDWLLRRLRDLTWNEVESRLSCCLTQREERALLSRRDAIVEQFERKVAR